MYTLFNLNKAFRNNGAIKKIITESDTIIFQAHNHIHTIQCDANKPEQFLH